MHYTDRLKGTSSVYVPKHREHSRHLADGSDLVANDLLTGWSRGTWWGQRSQGVKQTALLASQCIRVGQQIYFEPVNRSLITLPLMSVRTLSTHHNMLPPYTTHSATFGSYGSVLHCATDVFFRALHQLSAQIFRFSGQENIWVDCFWSNTSLTACGERLWKMNGHGAGWCNWNRGGWGLRK